MKYLIIVLVFLFSCKRETGNCQMKIYYQELDGSKRYIIVKYDYWDTDSLDYKVFNTGRCQIMINDRVVRSIRGVKKIDNVQLVIPDEYKEITKIKFEEYESN